MKMWIGFMWEGGVGFDEGVVTILMINRTVGFFSLLFGLGFYDVV